MNLDSPLDDDALKNLVDVCGDPERFGEFVMALEKRRAGTGSKAAALIRMLRGVVDMVAKTDPGRLEPLLRNMAQGFGKLSPELLMELLSSEAGRADAAADLVLRVAARMTDSTLGGFVARGVMAEGAPPRAWRRRSRRWCRTRNAGRGCWKSPRPRWRSRRSAPRKIS